MKKFNGFVVAASVAVVLAATVPAFGEERGGWDDRRGMGNATSTALTAAVASCMQAAIDARDTAVIAGLDAYYSAAKTAIQTRQTALKAAWAQTDQKTRREATKSAWDAYAKSVKSARIAMKTAHKATWSKFEGDRKACSPKAASDDRGSLGADSQL